MKKSYTQLNLVQRTKLQTLLKEKTRKFLVFIILFNHNNKEFDSYIKLL